MEKLNTRQQKYIDNLSKGMTKKDAALAAGYAMSTALRVANNIERSSNVRDTFAKIIRKKIRAERIADRISEGLDAMETKFFQHEGIVTDSRDVIAWNERRQYASLAAEFGGYFVPPKQESADNGTKILIQFVRDKETPTITVEQKPQVQES